MTFIINAAIGFVLAFNGLTVFTWGFWIIVFLLFIQDIYNA